MKIIIREKGTKHFMVEKPTDRIEALRTIVAEKQYAMIDGIAVDLFTASAIVNVYDALSDSNKTKFVNRNVIAMSEIAFTLLNKVVA